MTTLFLVTVLSSRPAAADLDDESGDWRATIDTCYDDSEPTASWFCYFTAGKLRMSWSPRDCVIEATIEAEAGHRSSALRWLRACACGNSPAADAIERAGDSAVDYAVSNYGGSAH